MKIKDFAKERNVNADAIRKRINRNQEYKKHTFKDNDNELCLDDELHEIFDKLYPYEKPIINERELELIKQIQELQREILKKDNDIIKLQQDNNNLIRYQIEYETTKYLLDNSKEEIKELKDNSEKLEKEAKSFQKTFLGLYKKIKQ